MVAVTQTNFKVISTFPISKRYLTNIDLRLANSLFSEAGPRLCLRPLPSSDIWADIWHPCLDESDPEMETGLHFVSVYTCKCSPKPDNSQLATLAGMSYLCPELIRLSRSGHSGREGRGRGDSDYVVTSDMYWPLSWPGLSPPTGPDPAPGSQVTCLLTFPHLCILSPGRLMLSLT